MLIFLSSLTLGWQVLTVLYFWNLTEGKFMKLLVYMEDLLYIQHPIRHFKESCRIVVCSLPSGSLYNIVEDKNQLI